MGNSSTGPITLVNALRRPFTYPFLLEHDFKQNGFYGFLQQPLSIAKEKGKIAPCKRAILPRCTTFLRELSHLVCRLTGRCRTALFARCFLRSTCKVMAYGRVVAPCTVWHALLATRFRSLVLA